MFCGVFMSNIRVNCNCVPWPSFRAICSLADAPSPAYNPKSGTVGSVRCWQGAGTADSKLPGAVRPGLPGEGHGLVKSKDGKIAVGNLGLTLHLNF